jgi:hypothetical protein
VPLSGGLGVKRKKRQSVPNIGVKWSQNSNDRVRPLTPDLPRKLSTPYIKKSTKFDIVPELNLVAIAREESYVGTEYAYMHSASE